MEVEKMIFLKSVDNVRRYREYKNLSQEERLFRANLHRSYIVMIERTETNITLINIKKKSIALEVKIVNRILGIFKRKTPISYSSF